MIDFEKLVGSRYCMKEGYRILLTDERTVLEGEYVKVYEVTCKGENTEIRPTLVSDLCDRMAKIDDFQSLEKGFLLSIKMSASALNEQEIEICLVSTPLPMCVKN